jgi:hypothetical protein
LPEEWENKVMAVLALLTYYYPLVMAVVFLAFFFLVDVPGKGRFFVRALVALGIAIALAHVNRVFDFWPPHRFFASGHMTFCFGTALSLGLLRPWTLAITLPLLVPFGVALVAFHFHNAWDVLGAIPLVLVVYGLLHGLWRMSPVLPPLDRATVSP